MSEDKIPTGRTWLTHEVGRRGYGDKADFFNEMTRAGRLDEFVDERRVERAIAATGDLNEVDYFGDTALTIAAGEGDLSTVLRLLNAGADVTQANSRGRTPLMCALSHKHWHIAEHLIVAGGLNDARDNLGRNHEKYYALANRSMWSRAPKAIKQAFRESGVRNGGFGRLFTTSPAICAAIIVNQFVEQKYKKKSNLIGGLSVLLPGSKLAFGAIRILFKITQHIRLFIAILTISILIAVFIVEDGYYSDAIITGALFGLAGFLFTVLLRDSWLEDSFASAARVPLWMQQESKQHKVDEPERLAEQISASLRFGYRHVQNHIDQEDPNWRKARSRILGSRVVLRLTWFLQFPVQVAFLYFAVLTLRLLLSPYSEFVGEPLTITIVLFVVNWIIQSWRKSTVHGLRDGLVDYVAESRSEFARQWRHRQASDNATTDGDYLVYLRPFDIDAGDSVAEQSLEALLVDALRKYGPVLSLGSDEQGLGAGRIETTDLGWKEDARQLLARSKGIIMIPHFSAGVRWEMQEIRRMGWLEHTVFVMPPSWSFTCSYNDGSWDKTRQILGEDGFSLPPYVVTGAVFVLTPDGALDHHAPFGLEPTPWHKVLGHRLANADAIGSGLTDANKMLSRLQTDHPLESDGDYGIDFEVLDTDGGFEFDSGVLEDFSAEI